MHLPLIGVSACFQLVGDNPFHMAGDKYLRAIAEGAGGMPMILPSFGEWYDLDVLTARLDGLPHTVPSRVEFEDKPNSGGPADGRLRARRCCGGSARRAAGLSTSCEKPNRARTPCLSASLPWQSSVMATTG